MKKLVIAALAAVCAIPAMAGDTYVGASIGSSKQKLSIEGESGSENKTSFKVFGGYQFDQNFGAEIGYAQFGKTSVADGTNSASVDPKSFYAAATGTLPLSKEFSLFAKLGVAANRTKFSVHTDFLTGSETLKETTALIGVGVGYAFSTNLSVIAEYENFGKVVKLDGGSLKVDQFSVGLRYKF